MVSHFGVGSASVILHHPLQVHSFFAYSCPDRYHSDLQEHFHKLGDEENSIAGKGRIAISAIDEDIAAQ